MEAITINKYGRCLQGILAPQARALGAVVLPSAQEADVFVMRASVWYRQNTVVIGPEIVMDDGRVQDEGKALVLWKLPRGEFEAVGGCTADILAIGQDRVLAVMEWDDCIILQDKGTGRRYLLDDALNAWASIG